jgi:hypothetical protein
MRSASIAPSRRRLLALTATTALGVLLAGCTTHAVAPMSAAAIAPEREGPHKFKEYTVYWAGMEVDGARLTDADSPAFFDTLYAPVGFTLYYGNCEGRGALRDGGCTLPLRITTTIYTAHSDASYGTQRWTEIHGVPAVVYDGGDAIEIYTDHQDVDIVADSPARAASAAAALEPFNRVPSPGWPAFPQPVYTPDPPQAQLNGNTGPTGVTGATTGIGPPSQLEPAP